MEFVEWSVLATCAGALAMVLLITQLTKDLIWVKKIPTQIWSYVIALAILYPAYYFTGQLTLSNGALILFNGMIIALAANGGFEAINRVISSVSKK